MVQLAFIGPQRKVIRFEVEERVVRYYDDIWKHGIQLYPMRKENVKALLASKSERMKAVGLLIFDANQGKNLDDYENCKSEMEICEFIKRESNLKGLKQIE